VARMACARPASFLMRNVMGHLSCQDIRFCVER
jgi:hypothetical protein